MTLHVRLVSAVILAALTIPAPRLHSAITRHPQPQAAHDAVPSEPVDINTASLDQLMKIPGLTRTWAARIIRFRPYRGKNELLDHGVVNAGIYARIKDHIVAHRLAPGGSIRK